MFEEYNKHDIAAYAGYIINNSELLECSSGGIATALARKAIIQGGYVAGVTYSDDFSEARYEIIDRVELIDKFKGSKYIDVNKGTVYKDVKTLLDSGELVLFFGLPCIVAALHMFLKKDYEKLITVELICHGPTSSKVHSQYIDYLQKKHNSRIVDFSVKKKMGAWTPGYLYAEFEDGQVFSEQFYHTEYGYAFSVMGLPQCYSCQFRGNNRTGDIMIGDFWGAKEEDEFWNKNGISSILVHTEKGNELLKSVEDIQLYKTTFDRIVEKNPNVIKARTIRPESEKFRKLFADHDLFYSVRHSRRLKTRIKAVIKRMISK